MTIKISELAKELEIAGKELVEKAISMGIEVKSEDSDLKEIDAKTLKNTIMAKRKKEAETKIVKVAAKKSEDDKDKEPKVQVKAAKVKPAAPEKVKAKPVKAAPAVKAAEKTAAARPGTPLPKSAGGKPPIGKPLPKNAVVAEESKKEEEPMVHKETETKKPEAKKAAAPQKVEEAKKPEVAKKAEPAKKEAEPKKEAAVKAEAVAKPEVVEKKAGEGEKKGPAPKKHPEKEKEKNKFNKIENKGAKKPPRSLEKKAKKKHVKQKPMPEPEVEAEPLPVGTKVVNVPITIAGFCEQVGVTVPKVILTLLKMGVVANQNQNIDEVTVATLADEMGIQVVIGKVEEEEIEEGLELFEDRDHDLKPRPPIITVMGHVDHGKTSLLDAIRKTNVTSQESGGITQHIGASEVEINGQKIVFLDTPGHEAFTAMRARGADITDIAILVVAADDSVKPQTIESISHAKAAGVPIIVAVNKIDKPGANPERVKQDLTEHGIIVEEWGGDVISVPVSAKTGEGIVNLLEMVLLQAEVLELRANPNRHAMGTVIEARLDKAKGPVASLLVT
ncbi:MAG: translation initiation factor IF-2 N-terminal domain-containing protein, partial [Anaerovoracaceae bacterium]